MESRELLQTERDKEGERRLLVLGPTVLHQLFDLAPHAHGERGSELFSGARELANKSANRIRAGRSTFSTLELVEVA